MDGDRELDRLDEDPQRNARNRGYASRTGNHSNPDSDDTSDETEDELEKAQQSADGNQATEPSPERTGGKDLGSRLKKPEIHSVRVSVSARSAREITLRNPKGQLESQLWHQKTPNAVVTQSTEYVERSLTLTDSSNIQHQFETPAVSISREQDTVLNPLKPTGRSAMEVTTVDSVQLRRHQPQMKFEERHTEAKASTATDFEGLFEFKEWDGTEGGELSPLSRRRPQVIVYEQPPKEPESFEYLCRVLRDQYSFIEGGEPVVEPVKFVSNRPQIPALANSVLRLDMTGDEWEFDTDSDRFRVRYNGTDVLPKLTAVSKSQFSGRLGYLVLNVPGDVGHSLFETRSVATQVYDALIDALGSPEEDNTTVISVTRSDNSAQWSRVMAEYLGYDGDTEDCSLVGVEDRFWRNIEQPDWYAIALTSRQNSQEGIGESDFHYLSKALIASKFGRVAYKQTDASEYENYQSYFNNVVTEAIQTESNKELNSGEADVHVDCSTLGEPKSILDAFIEGQYDFDGVETLAFEFETGRSEGAFGFRKVYETIDKYDESTVDIVGVVVPPWILQLDRLQSNAVRRMISQWNQTHEQSRVLLLSPRFDGNGCSGVVAVEGAWKDA
ncbi:hypothetical protein [Salinigranum halophilum]|uniref:hypothetical protein n=1 Tax=Salinigranum halophilum TaxID=2565931 RepID=UPI0010A79124|nr:hypothetical protein [Salinigranum halophilum]